LKKSWKFSWMTFCLWKNFWWLSWKFR
jgi:hypothetical protein